MIKKIIISFCFLTTLFLTLVAFWNFNLESRAMECEGSDVCELPTNPIHYNLLSDSDSRQYDYISLVNESKVSQTNTEFTGIYSEDVDGHTDIYSEYLVLDFVLDREASGTITLTNYTGSSAVKADYDIYLYSIDYVDSDYHISYINSSRYIDQADENIYETLSIGHYYLVIINVAEGFDAYNDPYGRIDANWYTSDFEVLMSFNSTANNTNLWESSLSKINSNSTGYTSFFNSIGLDNLINFGSEDLSKYIHELEYMNKIVLYKDNLYYETSVRLFYFYNLNRESELELHNNNYEHITRHVTRIYYMRAIIRQSIINNKVIMYNDLSKEEPTHRPGEVIIYLENNNIFEYDWNKRELTYKTESGSSRLNDLHIDITIDETIRVRTATFGSSEDKYLVDSKEVDNGYDYLKYNYTIDNPKAGTNDYTNSIFISTKVSATFEMKDHNIPLIPTSISSDGANYMGYNTGYTQVYVIMQPLKDNYTIDISLRNAEEGLLYNIYVYRRNVDHTYTLIKKSSDGYPISNLTLYKDKIYFIYVDHTNDSNPYDIGELNFSPSINYGGVTNIPAGSTFDPNNNVIVKDDYNELAGQYTVSGTVDTGVVGNYIVTYRAIDIDGNETILIKTFSVTLADS